MPQLPEPEVTTTELIYQYYEDHQASWMQPRLGVSDLGQECDRKVWYKFFWAKKEYFSGRMLLLFETGHLEEKRIVRNLRRIGYMVSDKNALTQKQHEATTHDGHFVVRADGMVKGVRGAPFTVHAGEFKTHNDKSFKALVKDGIRKSKFAHFVQCQVVMRLFKLTRCLYVARNKNDDALFTDRLRLDRKFADEQLDHAGYIMTSELPPPRIANKPTDYRCRHCVFNKICHYGVAPEVNCRTCVHLEAMPNAQWKCNYRNEFRDRDQQRDPCPGYQRRET